jgi:hypothetical protein
MNEVLNRTKEEDDIRDQAWYMGAVLFKVKQHDKKKMSAVLRKMNIDQAITNLHLDKKYDKVVVKAVLKAMIEEGK